MRPLVAKITNFPVRETNITKSTKTVIEMRCIETNQHFKYLEECLLRASRYMVRIYLLMSWSRPLGGCRDRASVVCCLVRKILIQFSKYIKAF